MSLRVAVGITCLAVLLAAAPASAQNAIVVIETSVGSITAELYQDEAPLSVENFLAYADSGFYEGTVFHRVIKGFMVQGGGLTQEMVRKETNPPIKNEATNGLGNERGTLAMARTGAVDSATAQFFINTVNNRALNHRSTEQAAYGYAVFGKVIDGMDVVDQIENTETGTSGPFPDVPSTPILITGVSRQ
jgi:cyclophilin family peptidyl-prolyl cis-trans isomerase